MTKCMVESDILPALHHPMLHFTPTGRNWLFRTRKRFVSQGKQLVSAQETNKRKMRRALFLFLAAAFCIRMAAVPALPTLRRVVQKDSCRLDVILRGDEHCHFFTTSDNVPVAESEEGWFYYLYVENNKLKLSTILAHNTEDRSAEESHFINLHSENAREHLSSAWAAKIEQANLSRRNKARREGSLGEPHIFKGNKKGLVILVNFANLSMSMPNPRDTFDAMFNEVGYNRNGAVGSVHDYFYDQSYGQFNLTFDVVGPVTVSKNYGYYGSNGTSSDRNDLRADEMIVEACQLADGQVNYANYDWDGDGEADQVYIIYAGYGEASGGPSNSIWPHEHHLEYTKSGVQNLDGIWINTYACSCELTGGRGTTLNGIGTACHEFSHCLGLPDLYDTGYHGGFGMSYWDLMDLGSYCGPKGIGEVPTGYSAYERHFAGWIKLAELNSPCVINDMPSIGNEPVAYAVYNDNHRDEYFLLENRQNDKWFSFVGTNTNCHGLLVTHVDYSESAWKNNKVNTTVSHQRMTIIPADRSYGSNPQEFQGDLFPGLSNATELTNTSHDAAGGRLYNLNTDGSYFMNKPITEISEDNGLISFYFMGGIYVPTPEILPATEITDNSFTANWTDVEGAERYTLELSALKPQGSPIDNVVLSETLAKFKTGKNTADGFTDLSDNLDRYMQNAGWTGLKVFTSQYGAKIGTTSTIGHLTTPLLNISSSCLTIRFTAKAVASAGTDIQFIIMDASGNAIEMKDCKLYNQSNSFMINFENIEKTNIKVKITSPDRFYLSDIVFYDGFYVESDLESYLDSSRMTAAESTTFENIKDNRFVLSNLTEANYRYRVRAHLGGAKSAWSPYQIVNIEEEIRVRDVASDGNDYIQDYYNLRGEQMNRSSSSGIYIIRYRKGNSKKIINK